MTDVALAEQLWTRAHEQVKRGDFAQAVRDLAQCYQLLQAANDPRVYEVHRRWSEVHQMYLEDGRKDVVRQEATQTPSLEAEAEAAANSGDIDKALNLLEQVARQRPDNDLVKERIAELRQAKARANDLVHGRSVPPAASTSSPPSSSAAATVVPSAVPTAANGARDEDDWSDVMVDDPAPAKSAPAAATPVAAASIGDGIERAAQVAPTMKPDDAPIGMQSLDVAFSVGASISADNADELPVRGDATTPPAAALSSADPVERLRELLARIQTNRRAA